MKHIFLVALFLSAAALQTALAAELCQQDDMFSSYHMPTEAVVTVTNCAINKNAIIQPTEAVESLTVTGGTVDYSLAIAFSHTSSPIDFKVSGVTFGGENSVGSLCLAGAISQGSTITISNNIFHSANNAIVFRHPDFATSTVPSTFSSTDATIAIVDNTVHLALSCDSGDGILFPKSAEITRTNVTLRENKFYLNVKEEDSAQSYICAFAAEAVAYASNITLVDNFFSVNGTSPIYRHAIYIARYSMGSIEGKRFKAATIASAVVTDEEARDWYGKASYTVHGNTMEHFDEPLTIRDTDGADVSAIGNEAMSSITPVNGVFMQMPEIYPVHVDIRENSFTSEDWQLGASVTLDFAAIPPKSTVRFDDNTFTTDLLPSSDHSFAVGVTGAQFGNGSTVSVRGNTVLPVTKNRKWDPSGEDAETMFSITASAASDTQPALLVCDNTLFGVKLDTDALLLKAVKMNESRAIPIASVTECGSNIINGAASVSVGVFATVASLIASFALM